MIWLYGEAKKQEDMYAKPINSGTELADNYDDVAKMVIMDEYGDPITITDQINTITYKYSPRYAARMTFSPTGLGGWIVTSILFGDTQFSMEFGAQGTPDDLPTECAQQSLALW